MVGPVRRAVCRGVLGGGAQGSAQGAVREVSPAGEPGGVVAQVEEEPVVRKRPLMVSVRVNQRELDWLDAQGVNRGHWFRLALLKAMRQDQAVPVDTFFPHDFPADITVSQDVIEE